MGKLLLVFAGTVFGALTPFSGVATEMIFVAVAVVLIVYIGAAPLGDRCTRSHPILATYLFQALYAGPIAVVALITAFSTWLAVAIPNVVTLSDEAQDKAVEGVVIGALTALLAAGLLDRAKNSESSLWPDARHKAALKKAFSKEPKPRTDSELIHAAFSDSTKDNTVKGWSFTARLKRARLIQQHADQVSS